MKKSKIFKIFAVLLLFATLFSSVPALADDSLDEVTLQYKEEFEEYSENEVPNWEISGDAYISDNGGNKLLKISEVAKIEKQFGKLTSPFVAEFCVKLPEGGAVTFGFTDSKFYTEDFISLYTYETENGVLLSSDKMQKISVVISNKSALIYADGELLFKTAAALEGIRGMSFKFSKGGELDNVYAYSGDKLFSSYDIMPFEDKFDTKLSGSVVLVIGSNEGIVDGRFKRTDKESPEVKPVIIDGRTYVPLRFIAEAFGVIPDWDGETQKIILKGGKNEISLTIGEPSISVDGEKKAIDSAPYITDGRTMLPVRAVSEVLEKYVFWDDSGLIVIADENKFPNPEKTIEKVLMAKLIEKMNRTSVYSDSDGEYLIAKELIGDEIKVKAVTATTHDGNVPENTVDGDLQTRWSAEYEQWIMFDLGEAHYIDNVAIAWSNGAARKAVYDLYVSSDGESWTEVFSGKSSGVTNNYEITDLKRSFRYLKYAGHGNSSTGWNSITEINFFEN